MYPLNVIPRESLLDAQVQTDERKDEAHGFRAGRRGLRCVRIDDVLQDEAGAPFVREFRPNYGGWWSPDSDGVRYSRFDASAGI